MALFNECMQSCARKVLDTADIVRDGDLSPTETARLVQVLSATLPAFGEHKICFRLSAPNRA